MILIDIDMPVDCNHCIFSSKLGCNYRCIVMNDNIHPSWVEKSLDRPLRSADCPLKEITMQENEIMCGSHPFIGKPIKYQALDRNGNVVEEKDLGVCTDISFDFGGKPINSNQPISFTFKGGS